MQSVSLGLQMLFSEPCEIRRLELQSRWDKEAINNVIGVLWRMTDGRWTANRQEIRDAIPIPAISTNSGPLLGVTVQSRTTGGRTHVRSL